MKEIVAATLIFLAGAWAQSFSTAPAGTAGSVYINNGWVQQDQMTVPKVTRNTVKHVIEDVVVTRECPAGYEGHYVDQYAGFDSHLESEGAIWGSNNNVIISGGTEGGPAYALCFKKDFMDTVRKNQDVLTHRPPPVRAVWNLNEQSGTSSSTLVPMCPESCR